MGDQNGLINGIIIIKAESGWIARFVGMHAAQVVELFGTADIPTPFGPQTPGLLVVLEVARRNPGTVVTLGE